MPPERSLLHARATGRGFAVMFVVAAVSFVVFLLLSFRGTTPIWLFNQGESGIWLDEAAQILDGKVMYRDFFEFVAPGVVYLNAGLLGILGQTAVAAQIIPLLVGVTVTLLLWRISTRALSGAWPWLPTALFVGMVYPRYNLGNHKWPAWACGLAAIEVLMGSAISAGRAAAGGALVGLSALFTQDLGAELTLGLLIAIWPRASMRARVAFLASAAAVVLLALGAVASRAGLGVVWYDLVVFPTTQYRNANGGFALVPVFPSGPNVAFALFQWAVSGAAVAAAVVWLSPRLQRALGVRGAAATWPAIVWPGLVVVVMQTASRAVEPNQTTVRCLVLFIALAGLMQALAGRWPRVIRWTALALAGAATVAGAATIVTRQARPATLVHSRAGDVWSLTPLPEVDWLQGHTSPRDAVFLFPDKGGLYYLTGTRNATSYPYLQDMDFSAANQVQSAIAELERRRPRFGIFDRTRLYSQGPIASSSLEPLYRFLTGRYADEEGTYFTLRGANTPAGR